MAEWEKYRRLTGQCWPSWFLRARYYWGWTSWFG